MKLFEIKKLRCTYDKQKTDEEQKIVLQIDELIIEKGKLVAIYRADHLNHYYMLTEEKNKDKIKLVYGIDFLNVKK